ncbi:MAG: serine/threonine-protein kinase, partial [Planctomycetota bacterium]
MKICLSCEGVTNSQQQRCGHCGAWLLPTDAVHYPVRRGEVDSGNPLLGTVVDGKYRLQSVLGRGGLGTVFQAVHIGSLMTVALKLLHPRFTERPEYRRALLAEARRAATVTHARCARLLDVGEAEEGVAYLAMELAEGQTLEALVRAGRLAPSHAVDVLIQVAEALEAIHAVGLVHCDLSPRNVMVAARGGELQVKVLDFGIARSVTLAGETESRRGEFAGFANPAFSAPEVLAGDDVDRRADLYSLGTLAWLLLTGSLPIDDTDPRRTAMAVQAGELREWPAVSGVPRRLQRLVQRCMRTDPQERPPSAAAVRHQLLLVRGTRRPAIVRAALAAAVLAIMAMLAVTSDPPRLFLRALPRSALELSDRATPANAEAQDLQSARLDTFGCHFGGFAAHRLRIDISRNGVPLSPMPLRPAVDGGTLTLTRQQPEWRDVVKSLLRFSRDGPVDVSFVVPGAALLGTARVRLDDEPPLIDAELRGIEDGALNGRTQLAWKCEDNVAVAKTEVEVSFTDGRHWRSNLPAASGTLSLGASLATALGSVQSLGAGELVVRARDRAGNEAISPPMAFASADVAAPEVVEVTGPAAETFVPCIGGIAHLRIRLSVQEGGCELHIVSPEGVDVVQVPLVGAVLWHKVEIPLALSAGRLASGPLLFRIVDAVGNRTEHTFPITLRDRDLRLEFAGEGAGVKWMGRELVMTETGASATATVGSLYRFVGANLELTTADGTRDAGEALRLQIREPGVASLHFGALPQGSHVLRLELQEGEDEQGPRVLYTVTVRVLPEIIEVRLPPARSRFLPGVLDAGLFVRRGEGLREGPGWRVDPSLLPYLRGTLWVGTKNLVPLPLPPREQASDPLLPEVVPVRGHNVLAIDLYDVLDRPARVLAGDHPAPRRSYAGRSLAELADFWWNDGVPLPIGEELLGEHGQPMRLRLRFPLPFEPSEVAQLRLGVA